MDKVQKPNNSEFAIPFVGFEVLTAVVLWYITLYSPLEVNRCFGGTCFYQHGRRIRQAKNDLETANIHIYE
jgi:hypothetical protein